MATSRTIVIAGAGIGGLTAALALAAKGFRIVILEKAERLEEAGAGLQLSPNASRVLIGLGLQTRLAPHVTIPDAVSIMSARSGDEVIRLPLGTNGALRDSAPYWLIHRADLQAALLAQVRQTPAIELRLGCGFEDFAVHAAGVTVGQRHGVAREQEPALALIGADGVWSAVRQQMFPDAQPTFAGLIAWRGTVDARQLPKELTPSRVQLWMGPKAHLVAYPMSAGQQINLVAIMPGAWNRPGWSAPGDAAELRDHFAAARWPGPARSMIGAVGDWRRWALSTMSDGGVWHDAAQGPVALLGDAAHAMLPFAAQGAGMAIEDAAVLAQGLAGSIDDPATIGAGLARYAAMRRARVGRVQRTARQSGQIYHLRGPMALARDLAMTALGPARLQARQDWIYDWKL
ncbi:MAG: monooxygenase [Tardiphaga sp.]|uniref:FAD-dependent monooxygenase n=1 Tax=Tardiphaga sp. TaxID=1926292 RepID=UPI0026261D39|nr:FAD-dependent monooxygenase [Tardiphaga sp.]MDB5504752.1 monooxygenase [Tardiphaga sp.]